MTAGDPVDAVRLSRPLKRVFTIVDLPSPVAPEKRKKDEKNNCLLINNIVNEIR